MTDYELKVILSVKDEAVSDELFTELEDYIYSIEAMNIIDSFTVLEISCCKMINKQNGT